MGEVRLEAIEKKFGDITVVRGINLLVKEGELMILVGPSGCGKSTLLRMIAGLTEVTAGDLFIGGKRANHLSPQHRNISMVFQSYALFPHMDVAQNIGFGPRIRKEKPSTIGEKVQAAAKMLNILDNLPRRPSELSGGQRQRVAMGRTIVRDPELFLFDEPLSNLDANLRVQMRVEIKALHQKLKKTIIYVTHDQIEAMTLADRIAVMRDGRIEQLGVPLDIYDKPANKFVAGFIGALPMSFLEGTVVADGLNLGGETLIPCTLPAAIGSKATIGVRPESFVVDVSGKPGPAIKVEVVEPTGAETMISGTISGQRVKILSRERVTAIPNEMMLLSIPPNAIHCFDAVTEQRLD